MTERLVALWPDELDVPDRARHVVQGGYAAENYFLTLLNERGEPVSEEMAVTAPPPQWVESSGLDSQMGWHKAPVPIALPVVERTATALRIRTGSDSRIVRLADVSERRAGAPTTRKFGAVSGWTMLVVSEFFDQEERFFDYACGLYHYIIRRPPFNEDRVQGRFGVEALYWRSGPGGLFRTRFVSDLPDDRRCYGEAHLVQRLLERHGKRGEKVLVLIDRPKRGGAGGVGDAPAWSTITGGPGENWEAIALHELGHSFGLADEYVASGPPGEAVEPNVTKFADAAAASWRDMRSPGIPHNPTCPAGIDCAHLADKIGTFEGARYQSEGLYRPSWDCRMNHTTAEFCQICQAQIRATILS